jgi:protein-tyrosine phosphatase
MESTQLSPSTEQTARLARFGVHQSVDIHCHCLPDIDDGPPTLVDAVNLCRALVRDGITTVVATPHQLGRYEGRNSPVQVRAGVVQLRAALAAEKVPLAVVPGGDVRIDHRLAALLDSDGICSLGDNGRHLLVELPHETYLELRHMIREFTDRGRTVIVSHPERHMILCRNPLLIGPWLDNGGALQVTAGSVLGDFGPIAEAAAWHWLEQGQVQLIATDAHDVKVRPPRMSDAITRIVIRLGEAVAKRICLENPLRVVMGEPLLPCEIPLARKPSQRT